MVTLLIPMMSLIGCDGDPPPEKTTEPIDTGSTPVEGFVPGEFCAVRSVFQITCVTGCHSGLVPEGGLDLDTEPYDAIVRVPGSTGVYLVEPGEPDHSLLYQRMIAPGASAMPPDGPLDVLLTDIVRDWIANGAPDDCDLEVPPPGDPGVNPHPPDWAEPELHGIATNLQTGADCRACHGADLTGRGGADPGVSCDTCHEAGWRDDCTYCHGGVDNQTGAPPQDIDGSNVSLAFPAHTAHVTAGDHPAYGCTSCHPARGDVLDSGHLFADVTPGYGELDYTAGLSPYGTYLFGSCSNLYCHGTGLDHDGSVSVGDALTCTSCHPDGLVSNSGDWNRMSGRHLQHMNGGDIQCHDCHGQTTDAAQRIVDGAIHVDGVVQVVPSDLDYDGLTCTGECHNHGHDGDDWPE